MDSICSLLRFTFDNNGSFVHVIAQLVYYTVIYSTYIIY